MRRLYNQFRPTQRRLFHRWSLGQSRSSWGRLHSRMSSVYYSSHFDGLGPVVTAHSTWAPPATSPWSSSGQVSWASITSRVLQSPVPAVSDDSRINGYRRCYHTAFQPTHQSEMTQPSDCLHRTLGSYSTTTATSRPSFQFTHGACAIPKRNVKRISNGGDALYSVGCGEDAYFCRHDSLGVADGVGGWEGVKNANPALFSQKLMHYAYAEVDKYEDIEHLEFAHYYDINPVDILRKSYTRVLEDAYVQGIRGSCTACLAILRDDELRIANLGDCGVGIIRQGEFIFRNEEQQHSFNYPYQIGTGCADRPEDAHVFTVKVQLGDIIVLGSDGLFDNLFDEDILEEIHNHVPTPLLTPVVSSDTTSANTGKSRLNPLFHINPQVISTSIAQRARLVSEESRFTTSPFQTRAMQEGFYHQGGKADDITVLVAVVADLEDSPDRR
ncbi:hypothetical protein IWQ61_009814 [Dispira simplex]|nr:hypothetical protein IWQ61_009814 [Dispira simplex]